jgi:hypothetical protein
MQLHFVISASKPLTHMRQQFSCLKSIWRKKKDPHIVVVHAIGTHKMECTDQTAAYKCPGQDA